MRVRTGRFRTTPACKAVVENSCTGSLFLSTPMLPIVAALTASWPIRASSVTASSTRSECSRSVWPFPCRVLWPLLTPLQVAPLGSPQIRARCFPARPPHLPPRLNPRLRCVVPTRRLVAGLDMRFLSVGPPVSSSLPPAVQLPSRRWLRVVVLSRFHVRSSYRGLAPHLQRAHAGRAPLHAGDGNTRAR